MVRTTIYLPEKVHRGMKMMAVHNGKSMADLLRTAIEEVYSDDLADLRAAQEAWKDHQKHPEKAVDARKYFAKRR